MKRAGFLKDAIALCAITLIAGLLLGGVYEVTKAPIERAIIAANSKAYQEVFTEAESFERDEVLADAIESTNEALLTQSFGGVEIEDVLIAKSASGENLGHVVNSISRDSYSGAIKISVGIAQDGSIVNIAFLEINDTPGLGLKAKEPEFTSQFAGKKASSLSVVKGGANDEQINAISGATITSDASANAVNAALYFMQNNK